MNSKATWTVAALAGVVGVVLGVSADRTWLRRGSETRPADASSPEPVGSNSSKPKAPKPSGETKSVSVRKFASAREAIEATLAKSRNYGSRYGEILAAVSSAGAEEFPELALWASTLKNKNDRQTLQNALYYRWSMVDPRSAVASVQSLTKGPESKGLLSSVLRGWAETDVMGAKAYVDAMPDGFEKKQLIASTILPALARTDPRLALQLADGAGSVRDGTFSRIFSSWAETDPAAAAAYALQLPAGQKREQAISGVLSTWAQADPKAAMSFAEQLPPGNARRNALRQVFYGLSGSNPEEAAKLVLSSKDASFRNELIQNVASNGAYRDLDGAIAWAKSIPDAGLRAKAINGMMHQWSQTDPVAAATFVEVLPAGPQRNNAISSMASNWATRDPQAALAWAEKLGSMDSRNQALQSVISLDMAMRRPVQWSAPFTAIITR